MKRGVLCLMAAALAAAVGFAQEKPAEKEVKAPVAKASIFQCGKCSAVALKAGKHCEEDLTELHVLAVKDGSAITCGCAADCKCKLNDDGAKCSCGKEVKKVALKGKFVCADGKCLTISDKAGKCACGKDAVEVK